MYMHSNFMIMIMQTSQVIVRGLAVCFLALHAGVWQLCCSKTELLGLLLCLHTKVRLAEKAGRSGRVAPVSLASDRVNTLPPQRCSSDRLNARALPVKLRAWCCTYTARDTFCQTPIILRQALVEREENYWLPGGRRSKNRMACTLILAAAEPDRGCESSW